MPYTMFLETFIVIEQVTKSTQGTLTSSQQHDRKENFSFELHNLCLTSSFHVSLISVLIVSSHLFFSLPNVSFSSDFSSTCCRVRRKDNQTYFHKPHKNRLGFVLIFVKSAIHRLSLFHGNPTRQLTNPVRQRFNEPSYKRSTLSGSKQHWPIATLGFSISKQH
jgi:hypothetical protein